MTLLLVPFYGCIIMQFFKNPEYNALKMVFMLFFFILVGVFSLGNMVDRQAENTASVLPSTTTVKKDRPWRDFVALKADGKLNGRELSDMLEVTVSYDTTAPTAMTLDTLVVKKVFTPRAKNEQAGFKIQTIDSAGKVLASKSLKVQKTEINVIPPQNGNATTGSDIESTKGSAVVLVPFSQTATSVRVVSPQGAVLVSKSLTGVERLNNTPTFKALDGREFQKRTRMPEVKVQSSLFVKKALAAGDPTKYEFVFIGNGYSSAQLAQFHTDVNNFTGTMLALEPMKSRASQLSFAYVDNTTDLSCIHTQVGGEPAPGRLITCNTTLATQLVNTAGAPYDKIVIITNDSVYGGSGGTIPVAYNGASGPNMIIHEAVGHSLGRLLDVYLLYTSNGTIDNTVRSLNGITTQGNCYAGTPPASAWSSMVGSADYTTSCNYPNWYDAGTSMMENLGVMYFTAPEQQMINTQLDTYTGSFADTSNPTISITSPANNATFSSGASVTVTANASDNLGIARVGFVVDGSLKKNIYTSPFTYAITGLTDGAHTLEARAYDAQNNMTTSSVSITVGSGGGGADTQAPTAPTNLTSGNTTSTSTTLTWGVSSDNVAVTAYDIYKNGTLATSTQQNTYTFASLTASTTYSFYVKARDAAGNVSGASNTVSVTTQAVSSGTTAITNPTQGQTITPGTPTTVSASAPTNATSVEFYSQFNAFSPFGIGTDSNAPFSVSWTPQGAGTYTFTAKSYNNSALLGTSAPVVITVASGGSADTTAPSIPTNLTSQSVTSSSVSLSWGSSVDNSGGSGMAGYYIYQNGSTTPINSIVNTGTAYVVSALAPNTSYSFIVKAKDVAGNYSGASNIVSVTTSGVVDTTAPSAPTNLSVVSKTSNSVSFAWTASTDNVGVTGYKVYRSTTLLATVTSTSYTATGLSPATSYNFTVNAIDGAGNTSTSSSILSVTTNAAADTTAPSVPTGLSASGTTQTATTIAWTASTDAVGVTGYDIYKNGTLVGSSVTTSYGVSGLTAGTTYSFTIKAKDATGNISAASNALSVTTTAGGQQGTTLTLTASPNPVTASSAQTVTVDVAASGTLSGPVKFWRTYNGNTFQVGNDSQAPYQYLWNTNGFGNSSYTMYATGTANGVAITSNSVVIVINK